jgi:Peptidase family M23
MSTSPGTSASVKYGQDYLTVGSGALAQFDVAINQNPMLGRFISADPIVSVPGDLQAYNRYSYVGNRPIMVTDPTGYKWWDPLKVFSQPLHASVTNLDRGLMGNLATSYQANIAWSRLVANHPRAYDNLSAAISSACGYFSALCQAGFAEFKAGVHSTSTTYAAQIGMETFAKAQMTGILFYAAGDAVLEYRKSAGTAHTSTYSNAEISLKVATHMGAGCVSAVMNDGSCGRGAASAGTSALFTGMTQGYITNEWLGRGAAAMIGGGASVIGGGKFSDGATVALAGYLWNEVMHTKGAEYGPAWGLDNRVLSVESGVVTDVGFQDPKDEGKGFGFRIKIRSIDGIRSWTYAHMDPNANVFPGLLVSKGDLIGAYSIPSNGNTTGPHLHLEVRDSQNRPILDQMGIVPIPNGRMTSNMNPNRQICTNNGCQNRPHNGTDWVASPR